MPFSWQSFIHIKLAFSTQDKKIFSKKHRAFVSAAVAAVKAPHISFPLFVMVIIVDLFFLKWRATTAATAVDPNLWYISSNQTFSCNVVTFFCFLGALSTFLVAIHYCYSRFVLLHWIQWKIQENWERSLFTSICNLLVRQTPHLSSPQSQ